MPTYPPRPKQAKIIRHLAISMLCLVPMHSLAGGHNSTKAQGTYQAAAILSNLSGNGTGPHPLGANVSATHTAPPQKHGSGWLPRNSTAWHNSSNSRELSPKKKARQFHHLQKTIEAQKGRRFAGLSPQTTAQPASFAVRPGNGLKLETRRQRQRREASGRGNVVVAGHNNLAFTDIIGSNCTGHFELFDDVTVSDLTKPVCPQFTGTLNSNGHRLNLTQTGNNVTESGLFGSLDHAHVNVNLGHVRVNDTVMDSGAIANKLDSNNTVLVRGGPVDVNIVTGRAGILGTIQGSNNFIEQNNMEINVESSRVAALGGVGVVRGSNNTLKQKNVHITVKAPWNSGADGGGFGLLKGHNTHLYQMGVKVNVTSATAGGGVGAIFADTKNFTLTQIGVQILHLGCLYPDLLGAAYGMAHRNTSIRLRLFSGDASGYPVCGLTLPSSEVTGFIDRDGYTTAATSTCGSDLKHLNTTNPADWREAHSELCGTTDNHNQTSCHYPHEQLVDAVHGENGTLWLVSRQHYPYKPSSKDKGLVRITGLNLSGVSAATANISFAEQGIRLLTNRPSSPALFDGAIPTAWLANQENLVALYPSANNQEVMLASFPLNGTEDGYYDLVTVPGVLGTPVHLTRENDNYGIWTWGEAENLVRRYQVEPLDAGFRVASESEHDLTLTLVPGAWVVGMGSANDLLYIVQRFGTDVLLDRIDRETGELFYRNILQNLASSEQSNPDLPEVPDPDTGLNYTVYPQGQGNDTVLLLPRRSVLGAFLPEQVQGIRVTLPEFGGRAEWHPLDGQILNITEEYQYRDPDSPGNSGANVGGIAASTVIAGASLLAAATTIGVDCLCKHSKLCKRCRKQVRQTWRPGKGRKSRMYTQL